MKTLVLLRHAKSSWSDESLSDYERPLNDRGRSDAPRMGKLAASLELVPDLIIASGAKRARQTAERLAQAAGYEGNVRLSDDLYLAEPEAYLATARAVDDAVQCLMLVGHNPGMEELVSLLAGEDEIMPTAALAAFRLPIDRWRDLRDQTRAERLGVWRPKEL